MGNSFWVGDWLFVPPVCDFPGRRVREALMMDEEPRVTSVFDWETMMDDSTTVDQWYCLDLYTL